MVELLHRSSNLSRSLDECNFINLLQRRNTRPYFLESRLAQKTHALFARHAANFRAGFFLENHFTNAISQIEQFMNRSTPFKSSTGAFETTLTFIEGNCLPFIPQPA